MHGCSGSTNWRVTSSRESNFFLEPVPLDFQVTNRLVPLGCSRVFAWRLPHVPASEGGWESCQRLLLPRHHLMRMHADMRGHLVAGVWSCYRGSRHFRLAVHTVMVSLLGHHASSSSGSDFTTFTTGPNFGEDYTHPADDSTVKGTIERLAPQKRICLLGYRREAL
jgi:hypothetical protein